MKYFAREMLAIARILAGEVVTTHKTVGLGGGIYAMVNSDRSVTVIRGGNPVLMMDEEQAKRLEEVLRRI